MQVCINQVTAGRRPPANPARDLARDMAAIREGGWEAVEVWLRHWDALFDTEGGAAARRLLDDAGLVASGACVQGGLFFTEGDAFRARCDELQCRLEQCQALGAPHLVVTPGPALQPPARPSLDDLDRAAENLHAAADLAARYDVRLCVEFLKGAPLVNNLPTALQVVRKADHPHVGVLVDTFHFYGGLSKLEDFDLLAPRPDALFFLHVNDVPAAVPRELWTDADRILPGTGAVPLVMIFERLRRVRYRGYVSLELFNDAFAARWAEQPVDTAREARDAVERLLGVAGSEQDA